MTTHDATFDSIAPLLESTGPQDIVWIQVGWLLDGVSDRPLRNAHLVYDSEKIRYVGEVPPPPELLGDGQQTPTAILPDYGVLPGLVEAHAHFFLEGAPLDLARRKHALTLSQEEILRPMPQRLDKLLRLGIMAVRDAGDNKGVGLRLQSMYRSQSIANPPMPYIDSPGAGFHHKGRYGSFMGTPVEDYGTPKDCVAAHVAQGVSRIKLIATGIINFKKGAVTSAPQMLEEELQAFVEAARSSGVPTFAHASGTDGIEGVIQAGVDSVEHGFFITTEQLMRMRDQGLIWVPTFAPVQIQIDRAEAMGWSQQIVDHLQRIIDAHQQRLREAFDMGVTVIAGSDAGSCGVPHGHGFLWELELMEQAGISPLAVLNAATGRSAAALNIPGPVGRIAAHYKPRMILTTHNPLNSVVELRKPKTTVFDGRVFEDDGKINEDGM
ncbi:MAG: amidohydrolase family protein [Candidatus Hydrogenedentes bacterium]|nr:amidohydrolase family protein [Candidatus Hydrogenedentota bacterium]